MAKKHEFRPDKVRFSILSHLILTQRQKRRLLKWILYTAMLLLLSVVQDVLLSRFGVQGATTELVPCPIFLICVLENSQESSIFALISSLLYLFSGTAPGTYSMVAITFFGVGICMFRQAFLQESFSSALLCTAAAMLAYVFVNFIFGLFLNLTMLSRFTAFLITAGLSLLAVPILYPIFKAISTIGGQPWNE